jgi:hypothetical protein
MKTYALTLAVTIFILTPVPAAIPQQGAPPASNQANSGPSLAVTMQFIQDKLNGTTQISQHLMWNASTDKRFVEYAQLNIVSGISSADPASCHITARQKYIYTFAPSVMSSSIAVSGGGALTVHTDNSKPLSLSNPWTFAVDNPLSLGNVYELLVMSSTEYWHQVDPTTDYEIEPMAFVLVVRTKADEQANKSAAFSFGDKDVASRVAKAMVHAVALCGGGSKDPF